MPDRIAAGYMRRSSVSGDSPGDASEEAQLEAVRRLCGPNVTIYRDWGISGATAEARPDYLRLKADIAAGMVASVCAYSLTRLGRNTRELLDFIDLCKRHDVSVRAAVEQIDTTSAMGIAMLTIMAAFGQLEREQGAERSASSRAARLARHERAGALLPGGKLPNSIPLYGFRHIEAQDADGRKVILREPDPDRPIGPVLDAYREAHSLRGACIMLNAAGIPSPRGSTWGPSTLARLLSVHDPELLPVRNATGRKRPPGKPARLRGLLVCQCGSLMTPNLARGQYRCPRGRDKLGPALHGPSTVAERRLLAALQFEARRIPQHVNFDFADAASGERERIAEAKRRAGVRFAAGEMPDAEYLAEIARLDAKAEALGRESGAWLGVSLERPIDLTGDPAEVNDALRRWWARVRLDGNMSPHVEWFIDPDELERREAAADELMG
jgi:Site-specific recombinases, DNA invertase Pin homologs